ncbi:hypothetical protein ACE2AJ_18205 [Aquihabitans daechungensis]|uniref:hypothetical protein n=1 Tax=Aquihabitans daechungensis TaxID=1052257 RepID=UPI003BA21C39
MTVGPPTWSEAATGRTFEAEAGLDPPVRGTDRVWWSAEATTSSEPGPVADAAVLAVVAPAMAIGLDVEVVGAPVTAGLLAGIEETQRAWSQWRGWTPVAVRAEEAPAAPRSGGAVLAYSGGVDSSYTAWRHLTGAAGPQRAPIDAAVFVAGFDIPVDHRSLGAAKARIAPPLEDRGLPVITAATNVRDLHDDWQAYHGFALASLLTFVGGAQSIGLIAATDTYERPVLGWGSNAITDPLLGSRAFAIRHDGAVDRLSKVRSLGEWPDLVERLRFCWAGTEHDRNCGQCLKCVTTAMMLVVLDLPTSCFDRFPDDDTICAVLKASPAHGFTATYNQPILDAAVEQGLDAPWVPALRTRLRRARYGPAVDTLTAPVRRRLPASFPFHEPAR